jgi:hypothetical protein
MAFLSGVGGCRLEKHRKSFEEAEVDALQPVLPRCGEPQLGGPGQ